MSLHENSWSTRPDAFKTPKRLISGVTARNLKGLVADDPKLSELLATAKFKQTLPNGSVGPSRESVRRFLQENEFKNVRSELKPPLLQVEAIIIR